MTDTSRLRIVGRRVELDAELAQTLIARGITQLALECVDAADREERVVDGPVPQQRRA